MAYIRLEDHNTIEANSNLIYDTNQYSTLLSEFRITSYSNGFLMKIYQYYVSKGFNNIIIKQITNLLNTIFLVLFTLFLFNCIDYYSIITMKSKTHLSNLVIWSNFFKKMGFFSIMCFIILIGFSITKIVKLVSSWNKYKKIQEFYTLTLNISDRELSLLEWKDVTNKLVSEVSDPLTNSYTIANQIMRKENYIIALISNKIIQVDYFTKLIEVSFIYCIIDHLFDDKHNLRTDIFNSVSKCNLVEHIKRRLKIMAFLYTISMPFMFIFFIFQSIFRYGEKFYKKPELLGLRVWDISSSWIFREYNELEHIFKKRMLNSKKYAKRYVDQFYSKILDTLSRFMIFIFSAFLIILILTSLLNESVLLKLYITENQTVLWYIGIFGSLITIFKTFILKHTIYSPNDCMASIINEVKYLPSSWTINAHKHYIRDEFIKYYQYQLYIILKECISIIIIPYILWSYCDIVEIVINFITNNTVHNEKLGLLCKYAVFEDNIQDNTQMECLTGNKLEQSFISFKNNNPEQDYNIPRNMVSIDEESYLHYSNELDSPNSVMDF